MDTTKDITLNGTAPPAFLLKHGTLLLVLLLKYVHAAQAGEGQ